MRGLPLLRDSEGVVEEAEDWNAEEGEKTGLGGHFAIELVDGVGGLITIVSQTQRL